MSLTKSTRERKNNRSPYMTDMENKNRYFLYDYPI